MVKAINKDSRKLTKTFSFGEDLKMAQKRQTNITWTDRQKDRQTNPLPLLFVSFFPCYLFNSFYSIKVKVHALRSWLEENMTQQF